MSFLGFACCSQCLRNSLAAACSLGRMPSPMLQALLLEGSRCVWELPARSSKGETLRERERDLTKPEIIYCTSYTMYTIHYNSSVPVLSVRPPNPKPRRPFAWALRRRCFGLQDCLSVKKICMYVYIYIYIILYIIFCYIILYYVIFCYIYICCLPLRRTSFGC